MEIENQNLSPLPNKFLVPFLEKASLEELDSPLIERWVDLLTSSSIAPEKAHPRFVQILSELTGTDAQLLKRIALNGGEDPASHCIGDLTECDFDFKPEILLEKVTKVISGRRRAYKSLHKEADKIYEILLEMFESRGVSLRDIILFSKETDDGWSFNLQGMDTRCVPAFVPEFRESVPILCSVNLLRQVDIYVPHKRFSIQIDYVYLTELGIEFVTQCDRDVRGIAD